MYLNQLIGQGGDWTSWLLWFIFMVVFFMFYPRIMLSQMMWKLEGSARRLEGMSSNSRKFLLKEISNKPSKVVKDSVDRFFEFFIITPVSLDPYGIVKKLDFLLKSERERFRYFVNQVARHADDEKKACIQMGMAGGIELYMLAKIVRHYIEMVKKTKSYQIAMILQMQLPLIERIAKALSRGTESLAKEILVAERTDQEQVIGKNIPLLVKLAPYLTDAELDDSLDVIIRLGINGVIATNTTISRDGLLSPLANESGGLSGAPLKARGEQMVAQIYKRTQGVLPIIGAGGIMAPEDALSRLDAGAQLVQVYTGLVYAGPGFVKRILEGLATPTPDRS